jgi:lipopolysaccharide biosynthesis glycosyltransferase
VHIAFATDSRFLPWCAVAIRSCLDNGENVTVHLLHDGSLHGDVGVDRVAAMVDSAGAVLSVHAVDSGAVRALSATDRYGTVVWLRFLLPELLPDVDRVLYLDADTLVVSALAPLHACDLHSAPFAAVANVVQPSQRARIRDLGIEDHRRFLNSGVLLLDLERMRAEEATATLLSVAATRTRDLLWPDQDTLNLVFAGRWHPLHPRWNAQYTLWSSPDVAADVFGDALADEARRSPAILHFEGPTVCKPWHALNSHPWRQAWRATLERTPWSGTPAEDRNMATMALRLLPVDLRMRGYGHLLRWRERRAVSS